MRRAAILIFFLFVGGTALAGGGANPVQSDDNFQSFWTKFKTAVIGGHSEAVAQLAKFPIGLAFPAPSINNRSELRQRFHEIFVDPINAAECVAHTEPSRDTEDPELYTVACRYDKGSDAAAYQFEHTKAGWKFTHFQLTTTCRCR